LSNFDDTLTKRAAALLDAFRAARLTLATAESCTGGMVAGVLTEIAGSSDVVERGFVTYSNEAKAELLGVPMELIKAKGAVSEEVARAMAEGALMHSHAGVVVSVTGIAGPGGATPTKPVGLVHFAALRRGAPTLCARHVFPGDRAAVRHAAVDTALTLLLQAAGLPKQLS
jgi:nicotinamide-nucleotide amidase